MAPVSALSPLTPTALGKAARRTRIPLGRPTRYPPGSGLSAATVGYHEVMKSSSVVEAGLVRVSHVGRDISGGPEMNSRNVAIAAHALRRASRAHRASQQVVYVPEEALAAVGVASTDELEVVVRDGELVLRPKRRQ